LDLDGHKAALILVGDLQVVSDLLSSITCGYIQETYQGCNVGLDATSAEADDNNC
jgi:hypothetical protein